MSKVSFVDVFGELIAISANPAITREKKLKLLRENLDRFSDEEFADNIDNILKIIHNKKEQCEKFKTTQEQVDAIYEIVPRLKTQEKVVYETISKRRKGFELDYE